MNCELNTKNTLLRDLKLLIDQGRSQAIAAVNSALTLTYWHVGRRINEEILKGERAEYGKQVVEKIADALFQEYGRGFEVKNLRRMMKFAGVFPDFEIVAPLVRQFNSSIGLSDLTKMTFPFHSPALRSGLCWYQIGLSGLCWDQLELLGLLKAPTERSDTSIARRAMTTMPPMPQGLKDRWILLLASDSTPFTHNHM